MRVGVSTLGNSHYNRGFQTGPWNSSISGLCYKDRSLSSDPGSTDRIMGGEGHRAGFHEPSRASDLRSSFIHSHKGIDPV